MPACLLPVDADERCGGEVSNVGDFHLMASDPARALCHGYDVGVSWGFLKGFPHPRFA